MALVRSASAQQKSRIPRIAILEWEPQEGADRLIPFREALQAEGYVDGQTVRIDAYFAGGQHGVIDALAQKIVSDSYDVIVAFATPAAHAAKRATSRIPIVFGSADPLGTGLVNNLARPGGNLTGVSSMLTDIEAKRLALLRELLPTLERAAYIASSTDPAAAGFVRQAQQAGGRVGVTVLPFFAAGPHEVEAAIDGAVRSGAQALIVQPLFTLSQHSAASLAEIVTRRRVPAIGTYAPFARSGGLMTFGPALEFARRRAAVLVGRILAGANPGELPVEQPTEFQLVINVRTAQQLGLGIPSLMLAQADEVIE